MKGLRVYLAGAALGLVVGCGAEKEPVAPREEDAEGTLPWRYEAVEPGAKLNAPHVRLPLDLSSVVNLKQLEKQLPSASARAMLARNGFVAVYPGRVDSVEYAYSNLEYRRIPIVVTTDSVLHLYHVLFDNTLMQIEQKHFVNDLKTLCQGMLRKVSARLEQQGRGELLVEADQATLAFFSVAIQLLDPEWRPPQEAAELVAQEIALINARQGIATSPLFRYSEDYSQYVPRGHYTRAEELKRYFKAMMWLGRMTFLLKEGLVAEATADRMTIQALLISFDIARDEELHRLWHRMYSVTAFFAGAADDLTISDYGEILESEWLPADENEIATKPFLNKARAFLARKATARIYSGTGAKRTWLNRDIEVRKTLEQTTGLRVMGQRFVPDSYMMSRLVGLGYLGQGKPFTVEPSRLGPIRAFPRGLDVMHLLGSERALAILTSAGDTEYTNYPLRIQELREFLDEVTQEQWHQNLYWSWLYALRTLLTPCRTGYPSFMQTEAYTDKALNTALASWSQLRHDTILYAKQSYTMDAEDDGGGGGGPSEPPPEPPGYVEPVPELYAELIALNNMSLKGLERLGVLPDDARERFLETGSILEHLLKLSRKELRGDQLSYSDRRFIRTFGGWLSDAIGDLTEDSKRTTVVADVHTDLNSQKVLEVASGELGLMWVVWKTRDGRLIAGAGPILSHYEFKVPMGNRLTDEEWRQHLKRKTPRFPSWTKSFRATGQ